MIKKEVDFKPIFLYVFFFTDEDSDADLVTDYLSAILKDDETQEIISSSSSSRNNARQINKVLVPAATNKVEFGVQDEHTHFPITSNNTNANHNHHHYHHQHQSNHNYHINGHNMHNNMVPIISVTPHSPGSKHNNILGKLIFYSV